MKKILFLFTLLSVQTIVQAQFNVGANAILQLPQEHFKNISKLGYGGCASFGYTFAQRVDLSLTYTIYGYTGVMAKEFTLNSKTAEAKFFFLKGNTRPYIGCGVGIFKEIYNMLSFPRRTVNNWGFEPKAGILLDSKMLRNLFVDASVSYLNIYKKPSNLKAFNLAVGLKYMIDFRKTAGN